MSDKPKVCLVCQRPIEGKPTVVVIDKPHGLHGVQSKVTLCEPHGLTDDRFIRKRIEDYYA